MSALNLSLLNLLLIHNLKSSPCRNILIARLEEVFSMRCVGIFIMCTFRSFHFPKHNRYYDCLIRHVKGVKKIDVLVWITIEGNQGNVSN